MEGKGILKFIIDSNKGLEIYGIYPPVPLCSFVCLPYITCYSILTCFHAVVNCGDLGAPTNGQRTLSSTTYNSVVTYTCDVGYTLQGSNIRTCESDGQWSRSVPQCNGEFAAFHDK